VKPEKRRADHRRVRRHRRAGQAGASKGEGLGNQFLANIREVDAIAHVVRCFENDDVIHVAGRVDPLHDIEVINTELDARRPRDGREGAGARRQGRPRRDKEAIKLRATG
jgi:hypothetical protein